MRTQEYLNQLRRVEIDIDRIVAEINSNYDRAMSISIKSKDVDVQTSGSKDPMGDSVSKIVDLKHELDRELEISIKTRETIINQIKGIKNNTYYEILVKRYIKREDWKNIEVDMKKSHRYMMSLHKEALDAFEKQYGSTYSGKVA